MLGLAVGPIQTHLASNFEQSMPNHDRKSIRFRGKSEPVLETFRVRGRSYFALEKLSRRGAYRVFDPNAGPHGDYRILYELPRSKTTQQSLEILRRLGGPNGNRNFPGIVDFVRQKDELFVVVAWINGTNLRQYLDAIRRGKTPRPSVPEVVRLVRGLVHGAAHYHRRTNIIHGDISPANIIITSGTTQLVLVDFGSAWPIENTATRAVSDGVTEPYAAPERIAGHAAEDFRSDAFSLSVIAYELLTLKIPFGGLGGRAGTPNLSEKMTGAYEEPSKLIRTERLPRRIVKLVDECIAKGLAIHPDERFSTTSEWIAAWDKLHFVMKQGKQLSRLEALVVDKIAAIYSLMRGKPNH
jgi:serine/threonine protein kinase